MISITRATAKDSETIVQLGRISVTAAHLDSAPFEILNAYIEKHYNNDSILQELNNPANTYHLLNFNDQPVGFSKIVFNAVHPNITVKDAAKLDRIYLLEKYHGSGLGKQLMQFNIELAKHHDQSGIWLFTWTGNTRAIEFYTKMGFTIVGSHDFHLTADYYNPNHQMWLSF